MQQQPSLTPIALHRAFGNAAQLGQLAEGEAGEEMEVYQPGQVGIDPGEGLERGVELLQLLWGHLVAGGRVRARGSDVKLPTPLLGLASAGVVDHESAHGPGCVSEKLWPAGELDPFATSDVEVGLMQQRGRAEGEIGSAAMELTIGDGVQLAVERGKQLVGGRAIARVCGLDELTDRPVHRRRPWVARKLGGCLQG